MTEVRHGTYAGAVAHRKNKEKPCPQCALAAAKYMAQWRARNPERAKATAARYRARLAADAKAGRALRLRGRNTRPGPDTPHAPR